MGKAKPGKQKTKSAAAKRFKLTGSGKVMQAKAGKSHLLSSKNDRQLKVSRLGVATDQGNVKNVKRMLRAA